MIGDEVINFAEVLNWEELKAAEQSYLDLRSLGQAPDVPDCPPCNCCGKEYAGKLHCGRCQCVFYCSRECQKIHWKSGGHRSECETIKERCKNAAKTFVEFISKEKYDFDEVISDSLWSSLDEAAAYNMALDMNLNGAIENLMNNEIHCAEERFRSGIIFSYSNNVMSTLFRSGRYIPGDLFAKIDAYRVKKYIRSSEIAFKRWFEASLKIIYLFLKYGMTASYNGDMQYFWNIQKIARDTAAGWSMVFTSRRASKAILLGVSKEPDSNATNRAKWIIQKLKIILPQFPQESPDNSAIEGQVNQFTAMIQIRIKEFNIDIGGDFISVVGLKGPFKVMYKNMAIPFAKATMLKGKSLTNAECQQALMLHNQLVGTTSQRGVDITSKIADVTMRKGGAGSSAKSRGKKKGKKKRNAK